MTSGASRGPSSCYIVVETQAWREGGEEGCLRRATWRDRGERGRKVLGTIVIVMETYFTTNFIGSLPLKFIIKQGEHIPLPSGYIKHRFHRCNYGIPIFCIFDDETHDRTGWTQWCWKGRSSLRVGSRWRRRHWQSPGSVLTSHSLSGGWRKYALLDVSLTVIMNEITSVSWQSRVTARCTPYAIYRLYARRVSSQATSAVARTCIQPPLPPRRTSLRFSSTESSTLL